MKKILPLLLAFAFLLVANTVKADIYFYPPEMQYPQSGWTYINDSTIYLTVHVVNYTGGSYLGVNGTLCLWTYDQDRIIRRFCGNCPNSIGCGAGTEFYPYVYNMIYGTYYWTANFTDRSNVTTYFEIRKYSIASTTTVLSPVHPTNNETIYGDTTNFSVTYYTNLYLPYDVTNDLYIHFYDYIQYYDSAISAWQIYLPSERLVCTIKITANSTLPLSDGVHPYNCINYMNEPFTTNYNEYLSQRYWRAKVRYLNSQIDGNNLLADTGFQSYQYKINASLANVYPYDEQLICDQTLYFSNMTWYDLTVPCNGKSWHNQLINFIVYLNDGGCGGGNLSIDIYNAENLSDSKTCASYAFNKTIDYYSCGKTIDINSKNITHLNYVTIHQKYNATYNCNNGSTYTTTPNDLWYIIGINVSANVTSGFATFPIPINMTGFMPSLSTYWASFFNTTAEGGLMFIAIFFLSAMAVLLIINADIMAGMCIFIYGILVFIRIGYINVVIFWILLVLTILIIVYWVRKFLLKRT